MFFKEIYSGVYPKWPNSWIHNIGFKGKGRRFFKEIYSGVYPKGPNSWIHNTSFKPLLFIFIFQCGINPLFFFFFLEY